MEFVGGIRQLSCDQVIVNAGGSDRQVVNKVFQEILEFWVSRQPTVDGLIFDISPLMRDVVYETYSRLYYLCKHKSCWELHR